jgi:fatty-acid desaturase
MLSKEQFKVYVLLPAVHALLIYGLATTEHLVAILLFGLALYYPLHHLGNGIGYHRLFAHKSFKPKSWYPYLTTFLSSISFFGSPMEYALVHRIHHSKSDQAGDPHSPVHGRLHSYILWIATFKPTIKQYLIVKDLGKKYPWMITFNQYEWLVPIVFYTVLFSISSTAGYTVLLASLLSLHAALSVNAFAHTTSVPKGERDGSLDILWAARLISPIFLHRHHHNIGNEWDYSTPYYRDRWAWVIKHFLMEKKDA